MNQPDLSTTSGPAFLDRKRYLTLAILTLLALGLRFYKSDQPLWLDEHHTAWTVSGSVDQIAPRAMQGNQSPLYFYIVGLATSSLGLSETILRLPSVAAGAAVIPLIYLLAVHWTRSPTAAFWAALLAAVDRDFLFYGQEARPYAMVQFVGLCHVYLFSRLLETSTRKLRISFVLCGALLFYLHYTAALLFIAEGVFLLGLYYWKRNANNRAAAFAIDFSIIALLCTPAAPQLLQIAAHRQAWKAFVDIWPTFLMQRAALIYLAAPLALAALLSLLRLSKNAKPLIKTDTKRWGWLAFCWLIIPSAIAWTATASDVAALFLPRYLIVSSAAAMFPVAFLLGSISQPRVQRICAIAILTLSLSTSGMMTQWLKDGRFIGDRNENWPAAIEAINTSGHGQDWPVFVAPGLIEDAALFENQDAFLREYCLFPVLSLDKVERPKEKLFPLPTRAGPRFADGHIRMIQSQGGCWLLIRGSRSIHSIRSEVESILQNAGYQTNIKQRTFGGVVLLDLSMEKK